MAHRALTLKYRPQVFTDLIGQDHVSTVLGRALESGRVAHAFLLTGARGVGKTTSARILAKALNCEKLNAGVLKGADPCNACTSCTEITAGVSLDVTEIDGASNRGIADVQQLREKVRFAPATGKYRVVIIDEVHQLSNDAFAALLKTLEEPPAHLVFIFATTDPQKLPDTIRSRTQRFDFARVPLRKVADRLFEIQKRELADSEGVHFELTDGAALLIAHKGEGSMRDSISALDQVISAGEAQVDEDLVRRVLGIPDREGFFRLGDAITQRQPQAALQELHNAFAKGMDPRDIAEGLAEHFRGVMVMKVDPERGGELIAASREDLARLASQGETWSQADLLRLMRIAAECQWPLRDSPQPIVHLEAAVLQMTGLEPAESLATLIARLEELERKLSGGAGGAAASAMRPGAAAPAAPSRPATSAMPPRAPMRAAPAPVPSAPPAAAPAPVRTAAPAPAAAPPRAAAPAPAPSAPPPVATLDAAPDDVQLDAEVEANWRTTIAGVNGRKRMLGAFLEESRLAGVSGGALVLAMDDLHRSVVNAPEHRAIVADELKVAFGRALELKCVALEEGQKSKPATAEDVKPMIDRAIQFFDAEVLERPGRGDRSA
jgi:DNA polymerase-3 subunit gamma/tau